MKLLRIVMLLVFATTLFALPHFVSAQTPNGAALYASNCQGCHGSLATSNVSNRTLAGIKAAIAGNVGGMGFLASLTDADIQAIANALSPPTPAPALSVAPSSMSFSYQQGGSAPAAQSLSVASGGSYTAAKSASWLSISATSGTTPGTVNVSVSSGMAAGTYTDNVTITASGATGSPKSIPVTLTVTAAAAPTLSVSPTSLNFTYAQGGAAPAPQSLLVATGGTTLNMAATASGGSWLTVSPASGTTPGTVNVSVVNPASMTPGTYNGTVTITASGATGSPQTVAVTLVVSAATSAPGLSASPQTLSFSYQIGGGMPAAQPIMISSSGAALSYTAAASGTWLSATPTSGSTPGTVNVSVNAASMAAGTYKGTVTITASGATGSPQTVAVTLVVSAGGGTGNSSLTVSPGTLHFNYQTGDSMPSARKLMITSTGASLSYTASYSGGSWLTVSPTGGNTPGTVKVSVNPAGMSAGSHSGSIDVSAPGAKTVSVAVTLNVISTSDDDGGQGLSMRAEPYINDPTHSGALAAQWVHGVGVPQPGGQNGGNWGNWGLVLSKNAYAPADAQAGALIKNAGGLTLTELGFDVREGGQCSAKSPHFVVVTSDDAVHVVGGCGNGTTQSPPSMGWKRMRFDPSNPKHASLPITPGQQVKSIAVVLDEGPEDGASAAGGLVVLDNISINGTVVGKK